MGTKLVIAILFLLVLYFLGSALFYTLRAGGPSRRAAKALTWRVTIALVLFLIIIAAYYLGWITPNPTPLGLPK